MIEESPPLSGSERLKIRTEAAAQHEDLRKIVKALASQVNIEYIDAVLKERKILRRTEKISLNSLKEQVQLVIYEFILHTI